MMTKAIARHRSCVKRFSLRFSRLYMFVHDFHLRLLLYPQSNMKRDARYRSYILQREQLVPSSTHTHILIK